MRPEVIAANHGHQTCHTRRKSEASVNWLLTRPVADAAKSWMLPPNKMGQELRASVSKKTSKASSDNQNRNSGAEEKLQMENET